MSEAGWRNVIREVSREVRIKSEDADGLSATRAVSLAKFFVLASLDDVELFQQDLIQDEITKSDSISADLKERYLEFTADGDSPPTWERYLSHLKKWHIIGDEEEGNEKRVFLHPNWQIKHELSESPQLALDDLHQDLDEFISRILVGDCYVPRVYSLLSGEADIALESQKIPGLLETQDGVLIIGKPGLGKSLEVAQALRSFDEKAEHFYPLLVEPSQGVTSLYDVTIDFSVADPGEDIQIELRRLVSSVNKAGKSPLLVLDDLGGWEEPVESVDQFAREIIWAMEREDDLHAKFLMASTETDFYRLFNPQMQTRFAENGLVLELEPLTEQQAREATERYFGSRWRGLIPPHFRHHPRLFEFLSPEDYQNQQLTRIWFIQPWLMLWQEIISSQPEVERRLIDLASRGEGTGSTSHRFARTRLREELGDDLYDLLVGKSLLNEQASQARLDPSFFNLIKAQAMVQERGPDGYADLISDVEDVIAADEETTVGMLVFLVCILELWGEEDPDAIETVQRILQTMSDSSTEAVQLAVARAGLYLENPETVLPALNKLLQKESVTPQVRDESLRALEQMDNTEARGIRERHDSMYSGAAGGRESSHAARAERLVLDVDKGGDSISFRTTDGQDLGEVSEPRLLWDREKIRDLEHSDIIKDLFGEETLIRYDGLEFTWSDPIFPPAIDNYHLLEALDEEGYFDREYDRILDIGCGTGFLGILFCRKAQGVGEAVLTDIHTHAVDLAKKNAKQNDVNPTFRCGPGWNPIETPGFDLALLNPPYIPRPPEGSSGLDGLPDPRFRLQYAGWLDTDGLIPEIVRGAPDYDVASLVLVYPNFRETEVEQAIEETGTRLRILSTHWTPMRIPPIASDEGWVNHLVDLGLEEWSENEFYDYRYEAKIAEIDYGHE